jgi:hypothetical protein
MPDPGFMTLAESLGSFSSVVFFVFVGASLLILWQVLIVLGAMISNLWHREGGEEAGEPKVA